MKKHILFPTDVEPTVVCTLNSKPQPEWQLLEAEAIRVVGEGDQKHKETYNPRVEWLNQLSPSDVIYAPMGGVGDAMLIGAADRGVEQIFRITYHELKNFLHKGEVVIPGKIGQGGTKQRERAEKVAIMAELVQSGQVWPFRQYREQDARIGVTRVYIGTLLSIQDESRKRLEQRTTRLMRDQAYFANGGGSYEHILELKAKLIESNEPIEALVNYERMLEKEIIKQLKRLPVWNEVLSPVKGMGPRIGARIIASTLDITRFPTWQKYCKFSGWHTIPKVSQPVKSETVLLTQDKAILAQSQVLVANKEQRIAARFTRGESGQFNDLLRQGMWLFSQQILRNNSQFRWYYDYYKKKNAAEIGNAVNGHELTATWLNKRAQRYAVSKFTKYLWHGWRVIEGVEVPYDFPYTNWLDPEKYWPHVEPSTEPSN
jgi:hypothetical protein